MLTAITIYRTDTGEIVGGANLATREIPDYMARCYPDGYAYVLGSFSPELFRVDDSGNVIDRDD